MEEKLTVLAVGAHPDDLELLCAGTLAKYAQNGHKVVMCHVCVGDKGHYYIPADELVEIRRKEAEESAKIIGAEVCTIGARDLDLYIDRETTLRFVDMVRQTKPDVIITHAPEDYMPDHIYSGELVLNASFIATLPHTETRHKFYEKITPIYYMDTLVGINFTPTEYVDITDTMEIKKQMLSCHKSQHKWLKEHDNIDTIELIETVARFRGLQCGVKYAEAFRMVNTWPRVPTKRLLP